MPRARGTGRGVRRGAAAVGAGSRTRLTDEEAFDESRDDTASAAPADSTPPISSEAAAPAVTPTVAPAASPAAGSTSTQTPQPSSTTGTRTTTGSRLRPRILRRGEAERDKLARQEEQKDNDRAVAEKMERGRSRTRSRRSRGDAMGARGGRGGIITASGPFSGGFSGPVAGRGGGGGSWAGSAAGGSGATGSSSFGGLGAKPESKGKGFAEADVRSHGTRINADKLHGMTPEGELDSEDEAILAARRLRPTNTMPMGIYREEHREQGVVVATRAELEAAERATGEEESLWVDGHGSGTLPPFDQPEEGIWGTHGKYMRIKKEPGTDATMDLDDATEPTPGRREEKDKTTASATAPSVRKVPKSEDELELEQLLEELGPLTVNDEDGSTKTEGPKNKDGLVYMFNMPIRMPPMKEVARPPASFKGEATGTDNMDTTGVLEAPSGDLTQDDATKDARDQANREVPHGRLGLITQQLPRGGLIGKLNIRKSGKAVLDWGGVPYSMHPGWVDYLMTPVVVKEDDETPQQDEKQGDCYGMGKIMGNFGLRPVPPWRLKVYGLSPEDYGLPPE